MICKARLLWNAGHAGRGRNMKCGLFGHPSQVYIEAIGVAEEPFSCLFDIPCEIWPRWSFCIKKNFKINY